MGGSTSRGGATRDCAEDRGEEEGEDESSVVFNGVERAVEGQRGEGVAMR